MPFLETFIAAFLGALAATILTLVIAAAIVKTAVTTLMDRYGDALSLIAGPGLGPDSGPGPGSGSEPGPGDAVGLADEMAGVDDLGEEPSPPRSGGGGEASFDFEDLVPDEPDQGDTEQGSDGGGRDESPPPS